LRGSKKSGFGPYATPPKRLRIFETTVRDQEVEGSNLFARGSELFQFFSRLPAMTKLDVLMVKRGCEDITNTSVLCPDAQIRYLGQLVDYRKQLHLWSLLVCDESLMASFEEAVPAGVYPHVVDREMLFSPGELVVNDLDIERLRFHIEYQVTVTNLPVVSHFEVESRGRYISFAPQLIGNDTMQWQVVMPSAK
jgi:hypothetical protein